MIYLATPYSNPDPRVEAERYEQTCRLGAALLDHGRLIFCPITHARPMAPFRQLKPRMNASGFNSWEQLDLEMVKRCDELWVGCLDGWKESFGVSEEIKFARKLGKPVRYIKSIDPLEVSDDE